MPALNAAASVAALSLCLATAAQAAPTIKLLQSFDYQTGIAPQSPPILAADGNLYGTLAFQGGNGHGAIYSISPTGKGLAIRYAFSGADGNAPYAGLLAAAGGLFYGTTVYGGSSGQGTIFSFDPSTNTLATLHSFDLADGAEPQGTLIADANGTLYGTTETGGPANDGTIFAIDPVTKAFTTLAKFNGRNGALATSSLALGKNGDLFGTTFEGGAGGLGVVFKFSQATGKLTVLHSFTGADGAYPYAGVTIGRKGQLYGVTFEGGTHNDGTLYELDPASGGLTVLHEFAGGADARFSESTLVQDGNGALLGTSFAGGSNDYGVVYKYDPRTSAYGIEANFTGGNGGADNAGLTAGTGRVFFGASAGGGQGGLGALFQFKE